MMDFLDLTSASDEERRLISEILSDTSVVNFAEPLKQAHHHSQSQPDNQLVKTNVPQLFYHQPQHNLQNQSHQNHTSTTTNNSYSHHRMNQVHNHDSSPAFENHRHTNHVQMPPPIAGDISSGLVSIDMTASQHVGYPIPHPPSTHVPTAYGPPPPHHMYGGPPIFQHYPFMLPYPNLVYGNVPPYPVLPATNSVVTPRQQQHESPQSNQQSNTSLASNDTHPSNESHQPGLIEDECNSTAAEPDQESPETNTSDKSEEELSKKCEKAPQISHVQQYFSDSSKSWASLFKSGDSTVMGSHINGEVENATNGSNNSDDDGLKSSNKRSEILDNSTSENPSISAASRAQRSQDTARRALDKMAPRLAQKINSITLKHSLPLLRPRGFINKGNGCYINSTLQALIACPPFYNLMKEIGDLKDLRRKNSCTPILDSFAELFLNFPPLEANKKNRQALSSEQKMQISQLQADALEPKCIYNALGQIKSECLRGAQEDAEEFLSSVLNGLHEEMIGLNETLQSTQANHTSSQNGQQSDADDINGDINNDDNLWHEVGPKNRSLPIRTAAVVNTPIQEIFGGSLFSIRTAGKDRCGHRSPFFDLQLDISGDNVKSLQDAIKSFTAPEIIHDFYCSKTKQKLDAQRKTSVDQLPPILILHLKQFIYTQDHGLKKLMKRIDYPIDFEIPDSCLHDKNFDKSLRNSRIYKLLAVVYHEGKEAVKGHYLTDVYHIGSSQWIRCDDSNLKVVPIPRIDNPDSSRTPYLLFYRRLNTLKPQHSGNNSNHLDNNKRKS